MKDEQVDARLRERGAAAVEFALVLIPLLLILFGTIYFALYLNARQGAQAAAREGARIAALRRGSAADACARAQSALSGVAIERPTVSVGSTPEATSGCGSTTFVCSGTGTGSTGDAYVKVSGQVTFAVPLAFSGPVTVTTTARFRCE
ncbi:MAG: TadE/TadG family type IV pilus assembly protein [Actinomycetes bacterium]